MAWNAFQYSLAPGDSASYWYSWGDDHGPQFAEAREFPQSTRGNPMTVLFEQTVRNSDNSVTYWVGIRNDGSQTATFELVGGGESP